AFRLTTKSVRFSPAPSWLPQRDAGTWRDYDSDLKFKRNEVRLGKRELQLLSRVATLMLTDRKTIVVLDGHAQADERANIAYLRATRARLQLLRLGVERNRILIRSFDATCLSDDGKHRRVEIYLIPLDRR